ncbi:MAG: response regulator [Chloroflexi bacterium]|nr:MAG: response regulator [Chloroflexota bacterium]MBL1194145.1 response regulator [Chloroflexota bacterium]NOH11438.1 response regulator [Chloroflexota bacterium]
MKSFRILILEDDPVLNDIYFKALNAKGYQVDSAQSMEAARSLINSNPYDVFLCDVRIGKQHGTDLLVEYKDLFATNGTQTVVASAFGQYRFEIEEIDKELFLEKPVSLATLTSLIDRLVNDNRMVNGTTFAIS